MLLRGSICLEFEEVVPCRSIEKEKIRVMCWEKSQLTLCMAGLSAPKTQLLVKTFKDCNKTLSTFSYNFFCYLQTYSFPKWQALSKGHKAALVRRAEQPRKTFPWYFVWKTLPYIINSNRQEGNRNKCCSVNKGTKAGWQKGPFWISSTFPKFWRRNVAALLFLLPPSPDGWELQSTLRSVSLWKISPVGEGQIPGTLHIHTMLGKALEESARALHLHIDPLALSCFFLGMGWEVGKI